MTNGKKYWLYAALMLGLGIFCAFPYFMQGAPPMRLHETPWQVGLMQAVSFILAGFCLARAIDHLPRR